MISNRPGAMLLCVELMLIAGANDQREMRYRRPSLKNRHGVPSIG